MASPQDQVDEDDLQSELGAVRTEVGQTLGLFAMIVTIILIGLLVGYAL